MIEIQQTNNMPPTIVRVDCPLTNLFADGIYWREILIPKGTIAVGRKHKTEHINVLLSGRVRVVRDGKVIELSAPQVFKSPAGVRKAVYAIKDTRWANVHPNPSNEQDMDSLAETFVEKGGDFLGCENEINQLLNNQPERIE